MRGRKPKPIERQIAEGDPRKRGKNKLLGSLSAQPKAARGLPPCAQHVSGLAKEAWEFWREELEAMDLDHRPDAMMLEGACVNYARAVEADEAIKRDGLSIMEPIFDRQGDQVGERVKSHPLLPASNAAWRNVHKFCSEFGLSPVSRMRLALDKKQDAKDTDDLVKVLSQPRERKSLPVQ